MNYLKTDTVGIDTCIDGYQKHLYDGICESWCLNKFDGYGRVYKNKKDNLIYPEYYINNKEYKEVLLDDRRNGIMFFSPSDYQDIQGSLTIQKCDVIFSIDLSSLGTSNHRQDEEFRTRVVTLLNRYRKKKEVNQIVTGLENVYNDYSGVNKYFYDMQDFHHFKVNIDLRYNNNNC